MPNNKMQRMAGDDLFFLFLSLGPPPLIFTMSPLRGNIAQDQERAAAAKFWVIDSVRTSNGFSQTHNTRS